MPAILLEYRSYVSAIVLEYRSYESVVVLEYRSYMPAMPIAGVRRVPLTVGLDGMLVQTDVCILLARRWSYA